MNGLQPVDSDSSPSDENSEVNHYSTNVNDPLTSFRDHRLRQRRNRVARNIRVGSTNFISSNYESLDYDICENNLYLEEERAKGYKYIVKKNIARWIIFVLIGMCTAFVACFIDIAIEELSKIKYNAIDKSFNYGVTNNAIYWPYFLWIAFNVGPVLIGSMLVTYVEPVALGSGIPLIKCYLNGIKIPHVVRFKTLLVKSIGVITTVVGGLAGGKEGPMIHSGAVIAAGISQGKSTTLKKDLKILEYFREDHEKRDFVSGGAAAGVAAAFGAPVGGVLFSLEEGASFWNQGLTLRILVASMVSTFTLNTVLSTYHGYPGKLSFPGLLNFGQFTNLSYELFELFIFVIMGAFGGLMGALFNHINYKLTVFRLKYVKKRYLKVIEAVIVAAVSAIIPFLLIYYIDDCKPIKYFNCTEHPVQMKCPEGEYNVVGGLFLQVPEASVRSFFHDPIDSLNVESIIIFVIAYYLLSVYTYGISVSAGLFIPSLLIGAAWGRLYGIFFQRSFPDILPICIGKYSLIGAAAQLGGIVRMTISLTVILIEATGDVTFGLPLIITLITAKWVGDFFNEGIYDLHIQLSGIPLIAWEPPPLSSNIYASEIMSNPVVTFKTVENVGYIMDVLLTKTYNGFPVVDPIDETELECQVKPKSCGHLRGLILRSQLIVLLQNKIFNESSCIWDVEYSSLKMFRSQYPRYPEIKHVRLTDEELRYTVNLQPFMNPSPYVVQHMASLPRIFRLFRALGLRHLVVINDVNQVVGMITRKDLARYKVWRHYGTINVEELKISDQL